MRHIAALSSKTIAQIEQGDADTLISGIACLAAYWMQLGGYRLADRKEVGMTRAAAGHPDDDPQSTPEQRALLAAGCDLYDMLALHPQGRQALRKLGAEPFPEDSESE